MAIRWENGEAIVGDVSGDQATLEVISSGNLVVAQDCALHFNRGQSREMAFLFQSHADTGNLPPPGGYSSLAGKSSLVTWNGATAEIDTTTGSSFDVSVFKDGDLEIYLENQSLFLNRESARALLVLISNYVATGKITPPGPGSAAPPQESPAVQDDIRDKMDDMEDGLSGLASRFGEYVGQTHSRLVDLDLGVRRLEETCNGIVQRHNETFARLSQSLAGAGRRLDALEAALATPGSLLKPVRPQPPVFCPNSEFDTVTISVMPNRPPFAR